MNLIVGTCFNYDTQMLLPFLRSLENSYSGKVVLFTNKGFSYRSLKYELEVKVLEYADLVRQIEIPLNSANNYRYFLYKELIESMPEADYILLTDVRDVIFQKNPFSEWPAADKLVACEEEKHIGDEPFNSGWIKAVFGEDYLKEVFHRKVYCSGTILGRRPIIETFLKDICHGLKEHGSHLDLAENTMIIDQALFIDWVLKHPECTFKSSNFTGSFYTMGHSKKLTFNTQGYLVNAEMKPYAILHQYDRFPFLKTLFNLDTGSRSAKHNMFWAVCKSVKRRFGF